MIQDAFFIDATAGKKPCPNRRLVNTYSKLHQIHDELNTLLYANPVERPSINSPKDGWEIIKDFMDCLDHEELWTILLDRRNRVQQLVKVYVGSVDSAQVRVGELFKHAIINSSSAMIIAHNHPSGDPTPSPDDVAVTRAIIAAGKLLDIVILDHIVIGRSNFVSLKERGLGFT